MISVMPAATSVIRDGSATTLPYRSAAVNIAPVNELTARLAHNGASVRRCASQRSPSTLNGPSAAFQRIALQRCEQLEQPQTLVRRARRRRGKTLRNFRVRKRHRTGNANRQYHEPTLALSAFNALNGEILTNRSERRFCVRVLEAEADPPVAALDPPVHFACSRNAGCLSAQLIQSATVGPNDHTIRHLETSARNAWLSWVGVLGRSSERPLHLYGLFHCQFGCQGGTN